MFVPEPDASNSACDVPDPAADGPVDVELPPGNAVGKSH